MDLKQLLKENGVEYSTSGKNVSRGYIGVKCPFPGCYDQSNHLGIRLKDLKVSCWKCGGHGIIQTLMRLLQINYIDAKAIVGSLTEELGTDLEPDRIPANKLILPNNFSKNFPKIFKDYLTKRNFNARRIIRKYNLMTCYQLGKYRYRIIIPIYQNGRLVSWTSRDITDTSEFKYRAASIEESIVDPNQLIYNFDSVKQGGDAFLVEGPFDVFRLGDSSFCFLGIKINAARLQQIALKNINRLFIFYDNDEAGKFASKNVAYQIAPLVKKVSYLKLSEFKKKIDPAMISDELVTRLKVGLEFN